MRDIDEEATPAWTPQPGPQTAFVNSEVFELVYGGARGGGKTDAALGEFARHARAFGAAARGLLVRRKRVALEPTIARARQIFRPEGARWKQSTSCFVWENGAVFYFRHLANDADAELYQGHDYTRVYVEELTQFPHPGPVDKLKATLRSATGAPCYFRATCNPGGPGHGWVKSRYIEAGAYETVWETLRNPFDGSETRLSRQFIPARLGDNPALLARDPSYVARLQLSGSANLVRAWLEGDWSIIAGAFFDKWSPRNIVPPFRIPDDWIRIRSFDWGYERPFSTGWWAVADEDTPIEPGRVIPRGAMVRYREWYGSEGRPNKGVRIEAEEVADGILLRERGETITEALADPSIFHRTGQGPTIGERLRSKGVAFRGADNTRVGKAGAMSGWDQMRARIVGDGVTPMLFVFDTCHDFIRTVPILQHDPHRLEDLDTESEDHIADETRYACMSRRLKPRTLPSPAMTFDSWRDTRLADTIEDWKTR